MPREVKAGAFKAKCLEIVDQVASTGETVVITKGGKPVARVVPPSKPPRKGRGFWKGNMTVTGDIVSPTDVEWDALKE